MTVHVDIHLEITGEPSGLEASILNALADKRRGGVEFRFKDGLAEPEQIAEALTGDKPKKRRGRPRKTEEEYRQEVVQKALALAAGSQRALVRKAVNEVGGKRVSTLTLDQLKAFDKIITEEAEEAEEAEETEETEETEEN